MAIDLSNASDILPFCCHHISEISSKATKTFLSLNLNYKQWNYVEENNYFCEFLIWFTQEILYYGKLKAETWHLSTVSGRFGRGSFRT